MRGEEGDEGSREVGDGGRGGQREGEVGGGGSNAVYLCLPFISRPVTGQTGLSFSGLSVSCSSLVSFRVLIWLY